MNDDSANAPTIERPGPTCPICFRDLEMRVELRTKTGKVAVALTCARHGSFPNGWQSALNDTARAARWAERRRVLAQRSQSR